ncbi:protein of unknown function DUF98 [Ferroglobus placidus DSM 10642]|uniref:Chorismate lyase n=1 Tax=Ferroglobus placidus (strain DSM 10642 / AEDII12DO) TaxID=589924 RepID=D3RY95_FERPA|nr:chorismate pyruvate-lyase family protein [Ferroglobus placidus]ADC65458.1 protein of unknown function DUF98 [Ferroglobus placidus DSM 10642]
MELNPFLKILATTDGSVTTILEALTGKEVKVRTLAQKVVKADERVAELLEIDVGDFVNWRVVEILADEILALAVSYFPIKSVFNGVREDLMRADVPIGKIIRKHNLEVRRDVNWFEVRRIRGLKEKFGEEYFLVRNYNIFHAGKILFNITEYFPVERLTRMFLKHG